MTAERQGTDWDLLQDVTAPADARGRARRAPARRTSGFARHAGAWAALLGTAVGTLMVISMLVGATVLQLVASLAALLVSVAWPPAGLIAMAFAAPLARPLVVPLPGIFVLMGAAMVFGVILRLPIERPRLAWPPLAVILLGLFVFYVAAQVVGGRFVGGPPANEDVLPRMARLMEAVMAFGVTYLVLRKRSPYPLLGAMLVSALVGAVVALSQVVGLESIFGGLIQENEIVGRITGTFDDPNYFGVFMAMMLTVAMALATLVASRKLRALLVLVAIPLALALLLTQSRGALIAFAAGIVVLAFTRSLRSGIIVSAGLLVLAAAAYPFFAEWRFGEETGANLDAAALTSGRAVAWIAALELVAASPVFGIGFARFQEEAAVGIGAHNWYVQVLAELGVTGIVMWALFIVAVIVALRTKLRPARMVGYSAFAVWLVGGLSLAPPTAFEVTGPLLIIVAAAAAADWTSSRLADRPRSPSPATSLRTGETMTRWVEAGASRTRP